MNDLDFTTLLGKICEKIKRIESDEEDNGRIIFTTIDGHEYHLYHSQSCCETTSIKDICGDLDDLIGTPIIEAEEVINDRIEEGDKVGTWSFYKLSTTKGGVTISFLGESNGYYSERLTLGEVEADEECDAQEFACNYEPTAQTLCCNEQVD